MHYQKQDKKWNVNDKSIIRSNLNRNNGKNNIKKNKKKNNKKNGTNPRSIRKRNIAPNRMDKLRKHRAQLKQGIVHRARKVVSPKKSKTYKKVYHQEEALAIGKWLKSWSKSNASEIKDGVNWTKKQTKKGPDWNPKQSLVDEFTKKLQYLPTWGYLDQAIKKKELERMPPQTEKEYRKRMTRKSFTKKHIPLTEQYTYDYVVVLELPGDGASRKKKKKCFEQCCRITALLSYCGMMQLLFKSIQEDELYVMFGAPEHSLRIHAQLYEFDLLLDPDQILSAGLNLHQLTGKRTLELCTLINSKKKKYESFTKEAMLTNIYGKYLYFDRKRSQRGDWRAKLYARHHKSQTSIYHQDTIFSSVIRLKLTKAIVEADTYLGGGNLKLVSLSHMSSSNVEAFFPLHDPIPRQKMLKECEMWNSLFRLPVAQIRDYFGETITLYFVFVSVYTWWLTIPAFFGTSLVIWQLFVGNADVAGNHVFAFLMLIWSTAFIEYWIRKESLLRADWGTHRFIYNEPIRPEFTGNMEESEITGKKVLVYSQKEHLKRRFISEAILFMFFFAVVAGVWLLFHFKRYAIDRFGSRNVIATVVPSLINAILILVLNGIFTRTAKKLNDYENHRTESTYQNALINKSFLFKFFNSFYSLFHIAFMKRHESDLKYCKDSYLQLCTANPRASWMEHKDYSAEIDIWNSRMIPGGVSFNKEPTIVSWVTENNLKNVPCQEWPSLPLYLKEWVCNSWNIIENPLKGWDYRGDCYMELTLQLGIIFVTQILFSNTIEIGQPIFERWQNNKTQANVDETGVPMLKRRNSIAEEEFNHATYDGTFYDYDELVVEFGYVILFVVAFPATPLIALLNHLLEFQVDSAKLMRITRRSSPHGAYDIGKWRLLLRIESYVAIVTNMSLLTLVPTVIFPFGEYSNITRIKMFLMGEHALAVIVLVIAYIIPDTPKKTQDHYCRSEYIYSMLIS